MWCLHLCVHLMQRMVSMVPSGWVHTWHLYLCQMHRMDVGPILCDCICISIHSVLKVTLTLMHTQTQTSCVNRALVTPTNPWKVSGCSTKLYHSSFLHTSKSFSEAVKTTIWRDNLKYFAFTVSFTLIWTTSRIFTFTISKKFV